MKMVKRIIRIGAWSVALAICVGWTIGCTQNKQHSLPSAQKAQDSIVVKSSGPLDINCDEEYSSVIESVCKQFEEDNLTMDEIADWDSMNEEGGYLLIRGAERYLDTIVNHIHIIFITEP